MGLDKGQGRLKLNHRPGTSTERTDRTDRTDRKARRQPMEHPPRHEKRNPPSTAKPITWHQGWQTTPSTAGNPFIGSGEPSTGRSRTGDDQLPFGLEHRVRLSTEPPVLMADGSREQQYLTASLEPQNEHALHRVIIGHNLSVGVAATLNEARRFALDILALVDQQELDSGGHTS
jgi:hypothetical protein